MKTRLPYLIILYFVMVFLTLQGLTVLLLYSNQKAQFENTTPNELAMFQDALRAKIVESDLTYEEHINALIPSLRSDQFNHQLSQIAISTNLDRLMILSDENIILADTESRGIDTTFPYIASLDNQRIGKNCVNMPFQNQVYHFHLFPFNIDENQYWFVAATDIERKAAHLIKQLSFKPKKIYYLYQLGNQSWRWVEFPTWGQQARNRVLENARNLETIRALDIQDDNIYLINLSSLNKQSHLVMAMVYSPFSILASLKNELLIITLFSFITLLALILLIYYFLYQFNNLVGPFEDATRRVEKGSADIISSSKIPHYFKPFLNLLNSMILEVQKREKRLSYRTTHDPITELPNIYSTKSYIEKRLVSEHLKDHDFAVVLVIIENYQRIVHTLGRSVSDRLLKHIAARLVSQFDAAICGRIHGEVFSMLFDDINEDNYAEYAKKILQAFDRPFSVFTVSIDVDAHIGIALSPKDGKDADTLLQKADVALYQAKHTPDHYMLYNPDNDPKEFNKLSLMSEMREGLDQHEFEVYYQPKVDINTGHIVQVEALARWNHPTKGFMSPGLFIPLAESTGNIKKLTLWVIEQSFKQCQEWHDNDIPIGISLNISVKDLFNPELIPFLDKQIKEYTIDPKWITLEITESAFMSDPEHAIKAIRLLADKGLKFAIDDFGTGYSSLSYLKRIPVHELKIDQSFTRDIFENQKVGRLVESTVLLGHSLDMVVVAEGIEDQKVYDILKSYHCDIGQGYLFSKPLSIRDFDQWVKTSPWGV